MTSVTNDEIETVWPSSGAPTMTAPDDAGQDDSPPPVTDDAGKDDSPPPVTDDAGRDDS